MLWWLKAVSKVSFLWLIFLACHASTGPGRNPLTVPTSCFKTRHAVRAPQWGTWGTLGFVYVFFWMNFQAFSNLRSLFVKVILTFFIGLFSFCYILLFLFIFLFSSIDSHCFILDADLQLYTTLFKTDFKTAFYKCFLLRSLQSHFILFL